MDKSQIIGLVLIFALFFLWSTNNTKAKRAAELQRIEQDSIAQAVLDKQVADSLAALPVQPIVSSQTVVEQTAASVNDSIVLAQQDLKLQMQYGAFAPNANGTAKTYTIENDKIKVDFSSKGGKIVGVTVKDYMKVYKNEEGEKVKTPVELLADQKNRFSYILPVKGVPGGTVDTEDLNFDASQNGNTIVFTAGANGEFVQTYTLKEDYDIDYNLNFGNAAATFTNGEKITVRWKNYLDKLELNDYFERFYSTVYFKESGEDSDYCNCRKSATEEAEDKPVEWVAHVNQFFNTTIMAKGQGFSYGKFVTEVLDEDNDDLKLVTSELQISPDVIAGGVFPMQIFAGPNEFERLRTYGNGLEEIIPFGRSLFGTINRWVIRPLFNFFDNIVGNKGFAIILMIFLIKLVLYPLTYKMLHSQAKMGALKPELADLKKKYKDDAQTQQMETMKIYREYGVSPLGGCMPMLVQMPIWYALFRFFPASIGFRQESFWWADDLSSYDAFFNLPFEIPFMGAHLSLFTILWVASQLIYTFYNTKHMDMSANPAMKYVQYFMPLMFLAFFNQYASGLTVYMFFSNLFNIAQTIGTKKLVFNEDKLRQQLMKNKMKPKKKKSKFMTAIENAQKQQQEEAKKKSKK